MSCAIEFSRQEAGVAEHHALRANVEVSLHRRVVEQHTTALEDTAHRTLWTRPSLVLEHRRRRADVSTPIDTADVEAVVDVLQCLRGAFELDDAAREVLALAVRTRCSCRRHIAWLEVDVAHAAQEAEDVAALAQLNWIARQSEADSADHRRRLRVADDICDVETCLERRQAEVVASEDRLAIRLGVLPILLIGKSKPLEIQ